MKSPWLPGGGSTDIHSNIKPGCWVSIQNKIVISTGSFSAFFTDLKSSQHFTSCCIDVQKWINDCIKSWIMFLFCRYIISSCEKIMICESQWRMVSFSEILSVSVLAMELAWTENLVDSKFCWIIYLAVVCGHCIQYLSSIGELWSSIVLIRGYVTKIARNHLVKYSLDAWNKQLELVVKNLKLLKSTLYKYWVEK